jgi:hypothetical protein
MYDVDVLQGQCHEIFNVWFFSPMDYPKATNEYPKIFSNSVSNSLRNYRKCVDPALCRIARNYGSALCRIERDQHKMFQQKVPALCRIALDWSCTMLHIAGSAWKFSTERSRAMRHSAKPWSSAMPHSAGPWSRAMQHSVGSKWHSPGSKVQTLAPCCIA